MRIASIRNRLLVAERGSLSLRDQMWIVHSLSPRDDLKADDLCRQLVEHAEDPAPLMRALEEKEKRTQSNFEHEVTKRLAAAGYRVTPHWEIGTFRIDLAVEGDGKRLAVECDGGRYYPLEKPSRRCGPPVRV